VSRTRTRHAAVSFLFVVATIGLSSIRCGGSTPPPTDVSSSASSTQTSSPVSSSVATTAPSIDPSASASSAATEPSEPPHWTYDGDHGPDHWGDLSKDWATCKTGTSQTPIDIVTKGMTKSKDLKELGFAYKPIPLSIFNNGHTVQVAATSGASATLEAAGDAWQLVQFHIHSPSEHTVDGKHFDAEIHFVHKNAKGAFAVVGIFLTKGKESKPLAPYFDQAPADVSSEAKTIEGKTIDLASMFPKKAAYYTYTGSLTIPPCTEGLTWFVFTTPAQISGAQLDKFRTLTHGDTNRPLQPLGARTVSVFK
jgi:carbonic anhydrase